MNIKEFDYLNFNVFDDWTEVVQYLFSDENLCANWKSYLKQQDKIYTNDNIITVKVQVSEINNNHVVKSFSIIFTPFYCCTKFGEINKSLTKKWQEYLINKYQDDYKNVLNNYLKKIDKENYVVYQN